MKQESPSLRHSSKRISSFAKPVVYFLCILFAYSLGYLSSSTRNNSKTPDHINTVVAHVNTVISSVIESGDHNNFGAVCGEAVMSQHIRHKIMERVFKGTSPWENFPPSHVDNLLRKKWVKGWGSNGAVFENLIRRIRPKTIIEVGTFLGASALHMFELTRRLGLDDTQIVCIDDFRGWPGFSDHLHMKDMRMVNGDVMLMYQFMQNVVQANATKSVVYMPFSSGSALEKLCEWGVFGELIEVDAGHDFHSAWSDINRSFKLLKPGSKGGVIFGHDYFTAADNRGVRRAVNLFARVHNLTVQVDGQHWFFYIPNRLSSH
ncbi:putative 40S ribosomal protein S27-3-like [Capsicum annuum]|nr:putative 40S ribosomal protein S27-3-like [Capsicum annuum]